MSFLLVIIMLSLAVYVLLKQRPRKTELPESKDACSCLDARSHARNPSS
jgi:hypothetical protein